MLRQYLEQGLKQLKYMHEHEMIANDIKPGNMGLKKNDLILYDFSSDNTYTFGYSSKYSGVHKDLRAFGLSLIEIRFRKEIKSIIQMIVDNVKVLELSPGSFEAYIYERHENHIGDISSYFFKKIDVIKKNKSDIEFFADIPRLILSLGLVDFIKDIASGDYLPEGDVDLELGKLSKNLSLYEDLWLDYCLSLGNSENKSIFRILKKMVRGQYQSAEAALHDLKNTSTHFLHFETAVDWNDVYMFNRQRAKEIEAP